MRTPSVVTKSAAHRARNRTRDSPSTASLVNDRSAITHAPPAATTQRPNDRRTTPIRRATGRPSMLSVPASVRLSPARVISASVSVRLPVR